jgi:uncharacterized protein (DUF58 family)
VAVSGWFVLLVAVGAVPVVLLQGVPGLVLWGVVLAVVVTVDLMLAGSPRALEFARDLPRRLRLGESAVARLAVANPGRRAVHGTIRDAWEPSAGARPTRQRLSVAAGEAVALTTTLRPVRRGERHAAHVTVRSFGPMRMVARQATIPVPGSVRVLPPFNARKHLPSRLARLRELDGRTSVMVRGQGTEFDSLREYVVGDDVRSIDWRGTARRADVVVRTWRPERDRRVVCVIDTGRTSAVRVGSTSTEPGARAEPRLDAAIDAALLLGELAGRAGDHVDILAIDTAVRAAVTGGSTRTLTARMVAALAPLQPALAETDFALVVGEVLRRQRKRSLVVLFTVLEPGTLGEGLLPVLTELTSRHTLLVAAVHDPELPELRRRRGSAGDVFLAAAAHRTLAERDRVKAALSRNGVEVVDAPVGVYASRVADAYLTMKATGRL